MGRRNQVCRNPLVPTDRPSSGGTLNRAALVNGGGRMSNVLAVSIRFHQKNSLPKRNRPYSVDSQKRRAESIRSDRARFTHPLPSQGTAANPSCHVRPPSGEWAIPFRSLIQRLSSRVVPSAIASTY